MSDGFERSTEFLPLAFSREQIAGQMQTIGSIEGRAHARRYLTTAREKGLMVRFRRQRHASHFLSILATTPRCRESHMRRLAVAESSPWPDSWWLQISAVPSVDWAHCTQSGISGPQLGRSLTEGYLA